MTNLLNRAINKYINTPPQKSNSYGTGYSQQQPIYYNASSYGSSYGSSNLNPNAIVRIGNGYTAYRIDKL